MAHKYRPYLTLQQLKEIQSGNHSYDLIVYLRRFIEDIEIGLRKSNYTEAQSWSDRIEGKKEVLDINALLEWYEKKGLEGLSDSQKESVQQHRYNNDMMTDAEYKEWEKANGIDFG